MLGRRGEPDYAIINRETGVALPGPMGRLPVVEGKMTSARASGGMIYGGMTYMDFGARRSRAPTVTILKRQECSFAAAGLRADWLANLGLRVRGCVEKLSGSRIEATRPEEIEIAEGK
jgi:hypothetical protein